MWSVEKYAQSFYSLTDAFCIRDKMSHNNNLTDNHYLASCVLDTGELLKPNYTLIWVLPDSVPDKNVTNSNLQGLFRALHVPVWGFRDWIHITQATFSEFIELGQSVKEGSSGVSSCRHFCPRFCILLIINVKMDQMQLRTVQWIKNPFPFTHFLGLEVVCNFFGNITLQSRMLLNAWVDIKREQIKVQGLKIKKSEVSDVVWIPSEKCFLFHYSLTHCGMVI